MRNHHFRTYPGATRHASLRGIKTGLCKTSDAIATVLESLRAALPPTQDASANRIREYFDAFGLPVDDMSDAEVEAGWHRLGQRILNERPASVRRVRSTPTKSPEKGTE